MKITLSSFLLCLSFLLQAQTLDTAAVRVEIDSLITLNKSLRKENKLDDALEIILQAEKMCLSSFGEETLLYASITKSIGLVHYYKGDFTAAEHPWLMTKMIREKVLGKEHPDYPGSVNNLGLLYKKLGQYKKAEPLYLEAKTIKEKVLGKEHPDYANSANNLGSLYYDMEQYHKAEAAFLEAKIIREKVLGKEHPDYANSANNLGNLYSEMGQYYKAETAYIEAKIIREKVLGKEHPEYAISLNNLGILYYKIGQYHKAETAYIEAKTIREKVLGKKHPDYARSLNNLGVLYRKLGQYRKAEAAFLEAKIIREKVLGKEHPYYARSLNSLGNLYYEMGQYHKAEAAFMKAKTIKEKVLGKEHPSYAWSVMNLGVLYRKLGQYHKAEAAFMEAKTIEEKVLGKEHPGYAKSVNNLGSLYYDMGQYHKAETAFMEAKTIKEKVLGKEHPDYAKSVNNLGVLYRKLGQYHKAEPLYLEANTMYKNLLLDATLHLSEKELLSYTATFLSDQDQLLSFVSKKKSLARTAYDNSLFHKGFLLNATQQVNRVAQTDSTSHDLFLQLKAQNRRLSTAYSKPIAERDSSSIAELEEKANTTEKELTRSVAGFGEALQQVTWQDVHTALKPGEAAIEFVHYNYHNPEKTDSIMYAALLLLSEGEPQFISLFEEQEINDLLATHQERRADYVNQLYTIDDRGSTVLKESTKSLYELIWKPIKSHLEGVNTIYFSPSGLLHRINLAAIPTGDEQALCDQYKLVQVNSTRQLFIPYQKPSMSSDALLMGGIEYELDSLSVLPESVDSFGLDALASRGEFGFDNIGSSFRGGAWNYLKYTQKEAIAIDKLLSNNGYQTDVHTSTAATEEVFRQNTQGKTSPRILHLATHGFFFPDPENQQTVTESEEPAFKTSDHPMIRSGLILAGGNHVWQGNNPIAGKEDGILTAYEISQLDLSNTELVVLSACETGLGDIEGNEGVYGLQRAFKIAGAKHLLMSLWQIPDRETKDFMVTLYEHLLEDKMSIPDAFRLTQKEMKNRFYNPYQWAGFVLVE